MLSLDAYTDRDFLVPAATLASFLNPGPDRILFVTAASAKYFGWEALVQSIQFFVPRAQVVMWDLGLTAQQREQASSWCNATVLAFPFHKFRAHLRNLSTYAFKPLVLWWAYLQLEKGDVVYWMDGRREIVGRGFDLVYHDLRRDGLWLTTAGACWPHNLTHVRFCHFFNHSSCDALARHHTFARALKAGKHHRYLSSERGRGGHGWLEADAGINGWLVGHWVGSKYLKLWAWCAGIRACIAPKGTGRGNHRQDQSALNMLLYQPNGVYDQFQVEATGSDRVVDGIPRFLHPDLKFWAFRNKKKRVVGAVFFTKHHTAPWNTQLSVCQTNHTAHVLPAATHPD